MTSVTIKSRTPEASMAAVDDLLGSVPHGYGLELGDADIFGQLCESDVGITVGQALRAVFSSPWAEGVWHLF